MADRDENDIKLSRFNKKWSNLINHNNSRPILISPEIADKYEKERGQLTFNKTGMAPPPPHYSKFARTKELDPVKITYQKDTQKPNTLDYAEMNRVVQKPEGPSLDYSVMTPPPKPANPPINYAEFNKPNQGSSPAAEKVRQIPETPAFDPQRMADVLNGKFSKPKNIMKKSLSPELEKGFKSNLAAGVAGASMLLGGHAKANALDDIANQQKAALTSPQAQADNAKFMQQSAGNMLNAMNNKDKTVTTSPKAQVSYSPTDPKTSGLYNKSLEAHLKDMGATKLQSGQWMHPTLNMGRVYDEAKIKAYHGHPSVSAQ